MIFRTVPTDPDHNQDAEDDLFYRDTLQELVQVGATLARLLQTQAIADAQATVQGMAPSTPLQEHAATFDRIARAIRRTIALARSLREPPTAPAPDHTARPSAAARTPALHRAGQDVAGYPVVTATTTGRDASTEAAKDPSADLRDRREAPDRDRPERPDRDAPDLDEDDTGRPPAAVIADIRRDLGLDTPPGTNAWTRCTPTDRTPADIEPLRTRDVTPTTAAATSPRQPGPGHGAAQRPPAPQPHEHDPAGPAACTQPRPVHPGNASPDDPAEAAAFTSRHAAEADARWRPPPTG